MEIDWVQCELIEPVPGKVSGRPVVSGTRILPDAIVDSYDAGESLEVIRENYCSRAMPADRCVKVLIDEIFRTRCEMRVEG